MANVRRNPDKLDPKDRVGFLIKQARAKRSLGLHTNQPLPRCHHKIYRKVRSFEAKGDFSHSDKKHACDECTCKFVAGHGTIHYGTGWCYNHDACHPPAVRKKRASDMTDLIRAGVPDRLWKYESSDEFMTQLRKDADTSSEMIGLRENQIAIISMTQMIIGALDDKVKPSGEYFTEMSNGERVRASDATLLKLLSNVMNTMTRMVKVELEVQDEDYVHWDECAIFLAGIMKIVQKSVSPDVFAMIINEMKSVRQPKRGRRKSKK